MTDRELMQQAIAALIEADRMPMTHQCQIMVEATITALRERLAQPEQEPVAHTLNCVCGAVWDISLNGAEEMVHTPDAPKPRREWVGLTKEEAKEISMANRPYVVDMIAALEARLKEKNT